MVRSLDSSAGRTYQALSVQTEAMILEPCLKKSQKARFQFLDLVTGGGSGLVRGRQCDAAWRVLDAQYFGVAQRRKRIFLVADFGAEARCAEQILFVEACVRRDPASSEGAREGSAEVSCRCAYEAGGATVLKIRQPKVKGRGRTVSGRSELYACDEPGSDALCKSVGTQFVNEGKLVTEEDYNRKTVGTLCSRDYKGPGNSHSIDDGKLILQ